MGCELTGEGGPEPRSFEPSLLGQVMEESRSGPLLQVQKMGRLRTDPLELPGSLRPLQRKECTQTISQ